MAAVAGALLYPDLPVPDIGSGQATNVGPGVHWLRLPLTAELDAINIWLLDDGDASWAVVDTGLCTDATKQAWYKLEKHWLGGRTLSRSIVTHMHPDHAGMAGWLRARYGARLWMTKLEYFTLRFVVADIEPVSDETVDFYRAAGLDDAWLERYRARFLNVGRRMSPMPVSFTALRDGLVLDINGNEWRCIVGRGHSPEHACLWAPKRRLFISGDQVLPKISSNVSVLPYLPDADPLADWLTSLENIRAAVPDDVLVLPAHGRPFYGLHARIDQLLSGHEEGLARLYSLLELPRRAIDVFPALFRRTVEGDIMQLLATGEALANLACLRTRGLARSSLDVDGIRWWERA